MIVIDEDSEHYKRMTLIKWKETIPAIKEEEALYCERQFINFANGEQTKEEALKEINRFLIEKNLIKLDKK